MKQDHPRFGLFIPRFLSRGGSGWICSFFVLYALGALPADQEPSYNGRLLSEWLADEHASSGVSVVGAPNPPKDAVRAMGTNAIPTLLNWVSYERLPSDKFPRASEMSHWRRHTLNPEELADSTQSAFGFLGAVAHPAISELTRIARTSSDPKRADRCAVSLAAIGPKGIPSLLSLATNGPPWTRYSAVGALEYFARKPEGVQTVPVLIRVLADTNTQSSVAAAAQWVLLAMGPAVTVSALTNALRSSSAQTRLLAFGCLYVFAEENPTNVPPPMVPFLRGAMGDPDYNVRSIATDILRRMGGWERWGDQWVRRNGTNALHGITPDFFTNAPPR